MFVKLGGVVSRLRFVLGRGRLSREASDELRFHRELLVARYVDSGMAPDEARLAAERQLGNVVLVQEDIYRMNSIRWLDVFIHDLRYAFRIFARNPVFVSVVAITLALGIGANTAVLSVVYSVLLKPLPYAEPGQIYSAEIVIPERRQQIPSLPPTVQTFFQWRSASTVFSGMAAMTPWEASITGNGEPERLGGRESQGTCSRFWGFRWRSGARSLLKKSSPGTIGLSLSAMACGADDTVRTRR